jgi:hypothetical protein
MAYKTWEELYGDECFRLKAGLEAQMEIVLNDALEQEAESIGGVCKKLYPLSEQTKVIIEAGLKMAAGKPGSFYVLQSPRH